MTDPGLRRSHRPEGRGGDGHETKDFGGPGRIFSAGVRPGSAPACGAEGPSPGGGQQITIRVCNNTNDNARVALSYQPVGASQFIQRGLVQRARRGRARTWSTRPTRYIYTYAEVENDGTRYWNGNYPLCVEYPGPYEFWSVGHASCEAQHEVLQYFIEVHTDAMGRLHVDARSRGVSAHAVRRR